MREEVVRFGRGGDIVGIVTNPPEDQSDARLPAILLLNSGMIHRVGPNRLYVKTARTLAAMGFVVLRFDFSGIGDSGARQDSLPFIKSAISETQEAMDKLAASRRVSRFVLAGICSGAIISLRTACCDSRVVGVISINFAGHRSQDGLDYGRTLIRHYKRIAFSSSFSSKTLLKALSGKVDSRSLRAAARSLLAHFWTRRQKAQSGENRFADLLRDLIARGVRVTLIHAEGDEGLDFVYLTLGHEMRRWTADGKLELVVIPGANHTFTLLANQADFIKAVVQWAAALRAKSTGLPRIAREGRMRSRVAVSAADHGRDSRPNDGLFSAKTQS